MLAVPGLAGIGAIMARRRDDRSNRRSRSRSRERLARTESREDNVWIAAERFGCDREDVIYVLKRSKARSDQLEYTRIHSDESRNFAIIYIMVQKVSCEW